LAIGGGEDAGFVGVEAVFKLKRVDKLILVLEGKHGVLHWDINSAAVDVDNGQESPSAPLS